MEAQTAFSAESGRTYRLDKLIGKGGLAKVYLGLKLRDTAA